MAHRLEAPQLVHLPLGALSPSLNNPRSKAPGAERVDELAASIRLHGILEPLIVVREKGELYRIVCGHLRWEAAGYAQLDSVPCIVRELTEDQQYIVALVENIQRESLDKFDEARAFYHLHHPMGVPLGEIASQVGRSKHYVHRRILLLSLPKREQEKVAEGKVSMDKALGYANTKSITKEKLFVADSALQKAWLTLRKQILGRGDARMQRALADFSGAYLEHERQRKGVAA